LFTVYCLPFIGYWLLVIGYCDLFTIFQFRRGVLRICYIFLLFFFQVAENPFVEDDGEKDSDGDAGIGEVEDGGEEPGTAPERETVGDGEEAEVEHVDYLSEEEGGVTVAGRPLRYVHEGAIREENAVEHAVDDVAERARDDEAEDGERHPVHFVAFDAVGGEPNERAHEQDAHHREEEFSDLLPETDAERHALVLHKMQIKPLAEQRNGLAYSQMRLNPNLDDLVNHNQHCHNDGRRPCISLFQNTPVLFVCHILLQPAKIKKYRIWGIGAVAFSRLLKVRHFEKSTILQYNKMNRRSVTNFLYFCHSFLEIELYEKNENFPADFGRFSGPVFLLTVQERPLLQDASHLLLFVQRHGR
jgi:hypothetical protein